jgi:hypothetical protein
MVTEGCIQIVRWLTPYWPVIRLGGVVALVAAMVVGVLWLAREPIAQALARRRERRRVERQTAQAAAEIQAIRSQTARQMARVARRNSRG